jgi:hypothetical protein
MLKFVCAYTNHTPWEFFIEKNFLSKTLSILEYESCITSYSVYDLTKMCHVFPHDYGYFGVIKWKNNV